MKYSSAKRICERCPVQSPCAAYAILNDVSYGLWGGMTTNQRKQLSRAEKREILLAVREGR